MVNALGMRSSHVSSALSLFLSLYSGFQPRGLLWIAELSELYSNIVPIGAICVTTC